MNSQGKTLVFNLLITFLIYFIRADNKVKQEEIDLLNFILGKENGFTETSIIQLNSEINFELLNQKIKDYFEVTSQSNHKALKLAKKALEEIAFIICSIDGEISKEEKLVLSLLNN
jgi:septin family protein